MHLLAYCRYSPRPKEKVDSDVDGDTLHQSIQTQKDQILRYCQSRNLSVPEVWFVDELVSARKMPLRDRCEGGKLHYVLDDIHGSNEVIAASADRLWRDTVDGLTTLREWQKRGVRVHFADGISLDTSSAHAELITTMLLAVAAHEPRRTAERTQAAKRTQKKMGRKTGRYVPYGWKVKEGQVLEVDWRELRVLDKVREARYVHDRAYHDIAEEFNEWHRHHDLDLEYVHQKRGPWNHSKVRRVCDADLPNSHATSLDGVGPAVEGEA